MEDEADDGERDRAPHHVARGRVTREIGDGDLGGQRRVVRERADVLGRLIGRPGAGLAQAFDERVEQRGSHLVADLDLELAEARRRAPVVEHGDGVVDDAADQPSVGVVQPGPAPDRRHAHPDAKLPVPDESAHELDGRRRRPAAVSLEHDLGAHEERRVALGGQLHRPALTRTVAQARAPARELQIVRVVVRRVVPLGRGAAHRRAAEAVDARHSEVGAGGQFQLAFGAVLHGRLRVASSSMAFEDEKRLAAEAAAELVEDGMVVGLGTGSTVALPAAGAGRPRARPPLRRHVACDGERGARARPARRDVRRYRRAGSPRHRDRRSRPGRPAGLARQGWRCRAHAREGRRRCGRPLRRDRGVGQARRAARATDPSRAPRLRDRGDAAAARRGHVA